MVHDGTVNEGVMETVHVCTLCTVSMLLFQFWGERGGYFNKFSQIRICFGDMFPTVLSRGYVQMLLIDEVMCMDAEELSA